MRKRPFQNIMGKGESAGNQHFLLSPTMFSTLPRTSLNFWVAFILSSANAFKLDKSKNFSFGKELTQNLCLRAACLVDKELCMKLFQKLQEHMNRLQLLMTLEKNKTLLLQKDIPCTNILPTTVQKGFCNPYTGPLWPLWLLFVVTVYSTYYGLACYQTMHFFITLGVNAKD